jgi:hypothetical protein
MVCYSLHILIDFVILNVLGGFWICVHYQRVDTVRGPTELSPLCRGSFNRYEMEYVLGSMYEYILLQPNITWENRILFPTLYKHII